MHSLSTPSRRPLSPLTAARRADTASLRCWFSSSNGWGFTSTVKLSALPTTNSSSYLSHANAHGASQKEQAADCERREEALGTWELCRAPSDTGRSGWSYAAPSSPSSLGAAPWSEAAPPVQTETSPGSAKCRWFPLTWSGRAQGKTMREGAEDDIGTSAKTHICIFCCEALLSITSVWLVLSSSLAVPSSCSYTLACCSFISRRTSSCLERYYRENVV